MSPINNNSATYKSLINEPTIGTLHPLLFKYTVTSYVLPLNNKSTNDILSLIYKSLMFTSKAIAISLIISLLGFSSILSLLGRGTVTTRTIIKSLIFFLLLCDRVEGTSINLTNMNFRTIPISISSSNISSTTMSNPPSPINARVFNHPVPRTPPPPPPLGAPGTGIRIN